MSIPGRGGSACPATGNYQPLKGSGGYGMHPKYVKGQERGVKPSIMESTVEK